MEVYRNLEYGSESEKQKLDLYLPSYKKGPFPLIIFIHGGGWQIGDKADGQENSWKGLVNNGYALASINYRLSPEAHFPESFIDCKQALKFLKDNANKYNLDIDNVAVTGNSAGGYYALMLATTVNHPDFIFDGNEDLDIKAAAVWYAPTDFYHGKEEIFSSPLNRIKYGLSVIFTESLFGKSINDLDDLELMKASPAYYVSEQMPPILMQQGTGDFIVPPSQAEHFFGAVRSKGIEDKITLEYFDKAGHVDPSFETLKNKVHINQFLDKYLKNKN